jgi:hypothetical protein
MCLSKPHPQQVQWDQALQIQMFEEMMHALQEGMLLEQGVF